MSPAKRHFLTSALAYQRLAARDHASMAILLDRRPLDEAQIRYLRFLQSSARINADIAGAYLAAIVNGVRRNA